MRKRLPTWLAPMYPIYQQQNSSHHHPRSHMPPSKPMPTTNAKPPAKGAAITATATVKKPGVAVKPGEKQEGEHMVPPPDTFWTRYSPNGEVFISPLSSFIIHGLLIGIILVGIVGLFGGSKDDSEEIEPVLVG